MTVSCICEDCMHVAAIKTFDIANGPGVRTSLFVSGCTHHCPGCFNAVAWDFDYGPVYTEETEARILDSLRDEFIDGLGTDKSEIAEQIIRGARSGKEIIICGKDSRLMTAMSSVAPVKANALYAKIMRSSGLDMFKDLR